MTTPRLLQRVCHGTSYAAGDISADGGFTLIEVVVSFVLFAIVATTAVYGIVNALQASHATQQRVDAANVAQRFIAQAIASANTIAPEEGRVVISNVGDGSTASQERFTVTRWVTFDAGDTCHPGTTFTVSVTVAQAETDKFLARSDSKVACPPA